MSPGGHIYALRKGAIFYADTSWGPGKVEKKRLEKLKISKHEWKPYKVWRNLAWIKFTSLIVLVQFINKHKIP